MQIVLDTNVLVSGLLNPNGAPGRVLDLILAGVVRVVYDDRVLEEYHRVLLRSKFGFEPHRVKTLLEYIRLTGRLVYAPPLSSEMPSPPDPDDLPFAEVAAAGQVEALVTGNERHFEFVSGQGIPVLSPQGFLSVYK